MQTIRPHALFNWDDLKHTEPINWLNRTHELGHKENEQAAETDVRGPHS